MYKIIAVTLTLITATLHPFEKIPEEYCVTYGDDNSPIEVIQYYSFSCPHCVSLFRSDFPEIKRKYLEAGNIKYTFHPVPADLSTVQAMICLKNLDPTKKRLFLEVLLEEVDVELPEFTPILMKKAMEVLDNPIEQLDDDEFIKESQAFKEAYRFIAQEDKPTIVPSLQIGEKRVGRAPDIQFVSFLFDNFINQGESYEY